VKSPNEFGISIGDTSYCLRTLADKGLIKIQNFRNSKNKMSNLYMLTPKGISKKKALTEAFLKHRMNEYESLQAEIEELKAEFSTSDTWRLVSEKPKST
jgi:EPS-associated MarR family transcriptional regulator